MKYKNLQKYKPLRGFKVSKAGQEIGQLEGLLNNPVEAQKSGYHCHKVPVAGVEYIVADAKSLNKHTNQSGRGNLRYLFDVQSKQYHGLAKEKDDGSYKKVA